MRRSHFSYALVMVLLWSGRAVAQDAGPPAAQPVDACAIVQCPAHASCLLTTAGPLCACDPGFVPEGALGCKATGCTGDEGCAEGQTCVGGKCIQKGVIERYRKTGKALLATGLVLAPLGVVSIGLGISFYFKARSCYTDIIGLHVCTTDESSSEYRLYLGFMASGIVLMGAGIALTIVGAVRLRRAKEMSGDLLARFVPFVAPVPGGAVAGFSTVF